jgi:hypothetical protein
MANEAEQQRRLEQALAQLGDTLEERAAHPERGYLLTVYYTYSSAPHPDSVIDLARSFHGVEQTWGLTHDEARDRLPQQLFAGVSYEVEEYWDPPLEPAFASMAVPFPRFALARFVRGRESLQGVSWGGINGFNDTVERTLRNADGAQFYVLDFPSVLRLWAVRQTRLGLEGFEAPESVHRAMRAAHSGQRIPVVELDPYHPVYDVTAAFLFPANERALEIFEAARATEMDPSARRYFSPYSNFFMGRWVRPENIDVLETF